MPRKIHNQKVKQKTAHCAKWYWLEKALYKYLLNVDNCWGLRKTDMVANVLCSEGLISETRDKTKIIT
jgi:hypothetical protein